MKAENLDQNARNALLSWPEALFIPILMQITIGCIWLYEGSFHSRKPA